jgi:Zn finger protein HypA/HybF involved in hydrogenase expression
MSEREYRIEIKLTADEISEIVSELPLNEQLEIAKAIVCQLSDKNRTMLEDLKKSIEVEPKKIFCVKCGWEGTEGDLVYECCPSCKKPKTIDVAE